MEYLQYDCTWYDENTDTYVLNLIINGIPSIQRLKSLAFSVGLSFKPYYKWNTFNTVNESICHFVSVSFKPYYKWNTFNTRKR